MIMTEVSNKIREVRARHKVTQEEVANFLDIEPATFRKKENGKTQWRMSEMFLIVYFFNTRYNDNLKLEDLFLCNIKEI